MCAITTRLSLRALAAASILGTVGSARAAVYSYSFSAGTATVDSTTDTAVLPIYLHESSSDGSSQLTADGGLFSFGLLVTITTGPGTIQNLVRNPAFDQFDGGTTAFPTNAASLWAEQNNNFLHGALPDAYSNVLLATLTLQNLTAPTSFNVGDFAAGAQTVDYAFNTLDPAGQFGATVSIPEPSALALISAAGVLALTLRRRHRQDSFRCSS